MLRRPWSSAGHAIDVSGRGVAHDVDEGGDGGAVAAELADEDRLGERRLGEDLVGEGVGVAGAGELGDPPEAREGVAVGARAERPEVRARGGPRRIAPAMADQLGVGDDGEVAPHAGLGRFAARERQRAVQERRGQAIDGDVVALGAGDHLGHRVP